ncbi:MAG: PDZ domain-containing protein [Verrucomicrobiota bacterium]
MTLAALSGTPRRRACRRLGFPRFALALAAFVGPLLVGAAAQPPAPSTANAPAAAVDETAASDDIASLAVYNVKADRIEDFGLRVMETPHSGANSVTIFFAKFSLLITAVLPNTAAARAGLQPGERILKSEGRSTVGSAYSAAKFRAWYQTQAKKWEEVAAGKKDVTWTLEVENPATKAVRTVKLVLPTPPPHWGASVWQPPVGRVPATVPEPGPLAERSRAVLDNGTWTMVHDGFFQKILGKNTSLPFEPTGYEWRLATNKQGDEHRIFVTQFRGRTDVVLEAFSRATGRRAYLTSPSGVLERAWRWTRKDKGEISLDEARAGFDHEFDLWTTKVEKVSARWPFEVKPGYDANAIFAVLAAKAGTPAAAVPRALAEPFLKLRPATEAQQALFADAYRKLGVEHDQWAYTEASRGLEDKRLLVTRVDPSRPEAERCVLLSIDGRAPAPADVERWRDDGGDMPKALGDLPPLTSVVDLKDVRIFQEETASVVFELPLRADNGGFPAEKFQALFRVNKTHRAFETIAVKLRDSFRLGGVVQVTEAGLDLGFQTLDPALAPQPVRLKAGGGVRVLLVKFSRSFEATRTEFKRVELFDPAAALAR